MTTTLEERRQIRREKSTAKSTAKFEQALKNIQAGGWGNKYMQCKLPPMTSLGMGDGVIETDREKIAIAATQYCRDLFSAKPNGDDNERTMRMMRDTTNG